MRSVRRRKVSNVMRSPKRFSCLIFLLLVAEFMGLCVESCAALTSEEQNTISVYERIAPSVVNITTEICDWEFFHCVVPGTGTGSGIVLKEDGLILTTYHVIARARDVRVALSDGRHLAGRIVGVNPGGDLALLKVEVGRQPLTPIAGGNSRQLQIGEKVLAVGNPFGLGQTLTTGTVSMVGRDVRSGSLVLRDLIQTDASINPGNSGGALVNSRGELVGMNTAIMGPTVGGIGIGFAVPMHRIQEELPAMRHPWKQWVRWILAGILVYWFFRNMTRLGRREFYCL